MNKFCFILALAAMVLLPTGAQAKDGVQAITWLNTHEVNTLVQEIPSPPATDSPEDQADFKLELEIQNGRTPERVAAAKVDAAFSVALFTDAIGYKITREKYPLATALLEKLHQQIDVVINDAKPRFKRLRPYQAHPGIQPLFQATGFSYPSGHSADAFTFAVILGQLFPDKSEALLERAKFIAESRVVAGVHYTSDIKAGEAVGKAIAQELLKQSDFQTELTAVRAELSTK